VTNTARLRVEPNRVAKLEEMIRQECHRQNWSKVADLNNQLMRELDYQRQQARERY
jgi:hypothetical protein